MADLAAGVGIKLTKEDPDVLRVSTDVVSGRSLFATWADLDAHPGTADGQVAEVPTSDAATHTDPVVGGTVDNSGVFRWSAAPAGWERISDVDALSASPFATAAAASAAEASADAATVSDTVKKVAPPGFAFSIADGNGDAAFGVMDDGTVRIGQLQVNSINDLLLSVLASLIEVAPPGFAWAVLDGNDDAALGILDDGTVVAGALTTDTLNGHPVADLISSAGGLASLKSYFSANVLHLFSYGQSLSVGTLSTPAISTAQRFDNLMFNGGVRAAADGGGVAARTAFVPLVESDATDVSGAAAGETPMVGATDMIKELILAENALLYTEQSFQLLGSADGFPAEPIANLAQGTVPYDSFLLADVTAGQSLAAAAGKTFKCGGFIWMQGESDGGNASYHSDLVTLRTNIDTDVKAITGQSEDIYCFAYGGQEMDIVLQFNQAAASDDKIIIVGPMYPIAHQAGDVHLQAIGEKVFGAYAGRAIKRTIIDGVPWVPLRPQSAFRQGKLAEVKFDVPQGPLEFDTANYGAQTNMGFRLYAADGTTAIAISAVNITQPDTVRITAATAIPANAVLRYGLDDPTTHNAVFGGNLRDSDATLFDGGGIDVPLRNWCICFEEILP